MEKDAASVGFTSPTISAGFLLGPTAGIVGHTRLMEHHARDRKAAGADAARLLAVAALLGVGGHDELDVLGGEELVEVDAAAADGAAVEAEVVAQRSGPLHFCRSTFFAMAIVGGVLISVIQSAGSIARY